MTRMADLKALFCMAFIAAVAMTSCSPTDSLRPEPAGSETDSTDASRIVLTIASVRRANGFVELDTITVVASVMTASGSPVETGDVTFETGNGSDLSRKGPRAVLLRLRTGANVVKAKFLNRRGLLLESSLTVTAAKAPGPVMVVWSADGSVREIEQPDGVRSLYPRAINDRGEVVGTAQFEIERHAFIWSESLGLRIIDGGEEDYSEGMDIDDKGVVVGYKRVGSLISGFLWTPMKGFVALDEGSVTNVAIGISASGVVAGIRNYKAVRWLSDAGLDVLATTPGAQCSGATAIGSAGHVIGWISNNFADGWCLNWSPVLWDPDGAVHTIRDCSNQIECSLQLTDVNGAGEVVGNDGGRPFRWTKLGGLHSLLGDSEGLALGINELGEVAGVIEYPYAIPVIWDRNDLMHVLSLPRGRTAGTAYAINNNGQVVGVVK
jgi:uncharacterized membrane protein